MLQNAFISPRPGICFGAYPECLDRREPLPLFWIELIRARILSAPQYSPKAQRLFLATIRQKRANLVECEAEFISAKIKGLRPKLAISGWQEELVAELFALISINIESHLSITLHDQQFLAAWMLLGRRLVEMQTGEGKTLAVALAAMLGALAGIPVHVVTANDYLVERDSAYLRATAKALGLTIGAITERTPHQDRSRLYCCDIVYCTARELVFDYLRDQSSVTNQDIARKNLRGLCMAIIDEADSVLIDEARTPFILSEAKPNHHQAAFYRQALFLAAQLKENQDYVLNHKFFYVRLTSAGQNRAHKLSEKMGNPWSGKRRCEEVLSLALAAQHLFLKDKHYLVVGSGSDRKIAIIDDTTGRQARDRIWSSGLHQLVEAKEGCAQSDAQQTIKQITFQRFFSRYLCLSGASGTLVESRRELLAIYGLRVAVVPLQHLSQRIRLPRHVFQTKDKQWQYVLRRIVEFQNQGRPVLVGTDSVYDSESLSDVLRTAGIIHTVLNARHNAQESESVAQAGQIGTVTISTNMAGRGTDIQLGEGVAGLGGGHVISCQSNESSRIDRQLYGRYGRQGQPGSFEQLYCAEGMVRYLRFFIKELSRFGHYLSNDELPFFCILLFQLDQWLWQRYRRKEQWFLFLSDYYSERRLGFSGG